MEIPIASISLVVILVTYCSMFYPVSCIDILEWPFTLVWVADDTQYVWWAEKPGPGETTSRLQAPCCYLLSPAALPALAQYLAGPGSAALQVREERRQRGTAVFTCSGQGQPRPGHPAPGRPPPGPQLQSLSQV